MRKSASDNVVRENRRMSKVMASMAAWVDGEQSPKLVVSTHPPPNGL